MRCILLIAILLASWYQQTGSKEVVSKLKIPTEALEITEFDNDLRGIRDIWNNIKNSARNAWTSVQNIHNNTKEQLKIWASDVKFRANDIKEKFGTVTKNLIDRNKALVKNIYGKGEIVKKCFQKENEEFLKIIRQLSKGVTSCINNNILKLSMLDDTQYILESNDTIFVYEVDNRLNLCLRDTKNVEECLCSVRKAVFEDMENTERGILKSRLESRKLIDNLLDAIVSCSVNGFIEASSAIAIETLKIVTCILQGNKGV